MKTLKTPPREDGRRPLTVYLPPELIRTLKLRALDEDRPAYEVVQEILEASLNGK